ncbi:MAG: hypothetical protein RL341_1106 [Pseudomonadota bacterium]|jgi:hypothetical protein
MQTAAVWFVGLFVLLNSNMALANSAGGAQVHHCLNAQGRAVFQDTPCESSGLRPAKRKPVEAAPSTSGPVRPAQAPRPVMPRLVGNPRTV